MLEDDEGIRFTERLPPDISGPVREHVRAHIEAGRPVADLGIEPTRPVAGLAFAVVGHTPKARSKETRHPCSYCETKNKFDAGPIVLMSDGKLRLIGPDCWHDHFESEAFSAEKRDYNLYMRRAEFNSVKDDLIVEARRYLASLEDRWSEARDGVTKADAFGGKLGRHMPQLYRALSDARRLDGRLQVERRVTARGRDVQAETEIAGVTQQRRQASFRIETVATLHGLGLLEPRNAADRVKRGLAKLEEARKLLIKVRWSEISLPEFGGHLRTIEQNVKTVFEGVERVNAVIEDAKNLFSPSSLTMLTRWARDADSPMSRLGELSVDGNSFRLELPDGSLPRVDFPNVDSMRSLPESDSLRRLVKGL